MIFIAGNFVVARESSMESDEALARKIQESEAEFEAATANAMREDEVIARLLQEDEMTGSRRECEYRNYISSTANAFVHAHIAHLCCCH